MYRRINITLPEETVRLVDRMAAKGDRSRFIAEAIIYYASATRRGDLKRRLREGAMRGADRDQALVAEWFDLEQEVWRCRDPEDSTGADPSERRRQPPQPDHDRGGDHLEGR